MVESKVTLQHVTREDVSRINQWLSDDEVSERWCGRYSYGDPAHLGYHPERINDLPDDRWSDVFENPEHRIFSIYDETGKHVGENLFIPRIPLRLSNIPIELKRLQFPSWLSFVTTINKSLW